MNTSSNDAPKPEQKKTAKADRAAYWNNYSPELIKSNEIEQIDDWRTVDLDTLSPIDRKLTVRFRNRADELGMDLKNAPEFATDMFKSPYADEDDSSENPR